MSWDPWWEAECRVGLQVVVRRLPAELAPAIWYPYRGRRWVVLDDRLDGAGLRAALAHELVHDERGGGADGVGMPSAWAPVVDRDEAACNREVARRLVPATRLAAFCAERAAFGSGVTPEHVGEEFEVPRWVAALALDGLRARGPEPRRTEGSGRAAARRPSPGVRRL